MKDEPHEPDVPVLVRIAGLPASTLEIFSRSWGASGYESLLARQEDLEASRSLLIERLYTAVGHAPPKARGFLLQVKRDCFNRRALSHHLDDSRWQDLGGPLEELSRTVGQEKALSEATRAFGALYRKQRSREVEELLEVAEGLSFRRGLALASPILLGRLPRQRRLDTGSWSRRQRKLASSLARYATRCAAKLSPYSTFTRIAVGTARSTPEPSAPTSRKEFSCPWQERSLLRVKPYLLDQLHDLLKTRTIARDPSLVRWNDTVRPIGEGRYRWLRPGSWAPDEESGRLRLRRPALAGARLDGPLIEVAEELLTERERTWGALVADLEHALKAPREPITETVDRLLDMGVLLLLPPWRPDESRAEVALRESLGQAAHSDPSLCAACDSLDRLIQLQDDFATEDDPLSMVRWMEATLRDLERELVGTVRKQRAPSAQTLFEDVFLVPDAESSKSIEKKPVSLYETSLGTAQDAVRSLTPWMRLLPIHGLRLELLHTFSAFLDRYAPKAKAVSLLEAFEAFQPLWSELTRIAGSRFPTGGPEDWQVRFNPLDLSILSELQDHRQTVQEGLKNRYLPAAEDSKRALEALEDLAAGLPSGWSTPFGPCLFLQPTGTTDPAWVLNRLFEGTGRYGSRFTAAMEESSRRAYTDRLRAHASFEWCGDRVELLDLMCVAGDSLNVHSVQTPWVLSLPGDRAPRQGEIARLADLRIETFSVDSRIRLPRLLHVSGTRLWPVYLGGSARVFTPPIVQFLSLLGHDEVPSLLPPQLWHEAGEVRIRPRQAVGNVVIHRRAWAFPIASLQQRLQGLEDAQAFLAIQRWRRRWGLPDRVFFIDRVRHPSGRDAFKPQLLDFASPLLVSLLVSAITAETADPTLTVEEMLPLPEAWPSDPAGDRWATEAQLDSLSLFHPGALHSDPLSPALERMPRPAQLSVEAWQSHPAWSSARDAGGGVA